MSKELQIGQIGVIDGVKVECVRNNSERCERGNCAFCKISENKHHSFHICYANDAAECRAAYRSDNTDVYFKKIEV